MSTSNKIVTSTVNEISFSVNQTSYGQALKKIKSIGKAWDNVGKSYERSAERFKSHPVFGGNGGSSPNKPSKPNSTKPQREALRRQREQLQLEKKLNTIKARGIRFSTATNSYNLTAPQRAQAIQDFSQLTKQFHNGSLALGVYNARVAQLQQRLRQQGGLVKKPVTVPVKARITKLDTSLLDQAGPAIAIGATIGIGATIMRTGQDMDSVISGLTAVTGSSETAAKEFEYLRGEANRLGLDLVKTSQEYMKFSAATKSSMTEAQTKSIFAGLSEYSTVLGLSAEKSSLALNALTQMSSKSVVSMEELRQQFGDQIPGALAIFTKAYNKVNKTALSEGEFAKLVGDGKVLAKNVLPAVGDELKALARNGGALNKAVNSNRAAFQRLQTSMQLSQKNLFDAGFGKSLTDAFNGVTDAINSNQSAFSSLGEVSGKVIDGFMAVAGGVYNAFIDIDGIIKTYLPSISKSFEGLGNTAAYATGIALFTGSLWKLGGALKYIVGFLNPLRGVVGTLQTLGGLGGITTPGTDNNGNQGADKGKPGRKPTKAGRGGFSIGLPAVIAGVSLWNQVDEVQADPQAFLKNVQKNNNRPTMWTDIKEFFATHSLGLTNSFVGMNTLPGLPGMQPAVAGQSGMTYQPMAQLPGIDNLATSLGLDKPLEVAGKADLQVNNEIKLTFDDSRFSDAIRAVVQEQNIYNMNMLLGTQE
ncbi:tape measure protein [Buttiauxella selenatireducens]|uniref:Tape measure protein n=1 Tax=Buttiauxella selenatireducens TaxID=3073902 RepID=A0ABY9SHD5_9ENTR|nr:tape measure protein [Buttiauxella sp. R73]WMY75831.1 tape measure protein [Buttiauxella sp. R73]